MLKILRNNLKNSFKYKKINSININIKLFQSFQFFSNKITIENSKNLKNEIETENETEKKKKFTSFQDIPGVKTEGEKYAMVYTCKVCNTRSIKQISKQGYHHGCVLVRCPGCLNLHLIADHIGIFEDKGWTIESYLAEYGESVKRVDNDGVLELTRADIIGSTTTNNSEDKI